MGGHAIEGLGGLRTCLPSCDQRLPPPPHCQHRCYTPGHVLSDLMKNDIEYKMAILL